MNNWQTPYRTASDPLMVMDLSLLKRTLMLTTVSRLLVAVPVHLPMILSMHFLWMAALHS